MKITVETNGEVITMELHNDNTIWELIPKLKIMLIFCGYSEDLINQIIEDNEWQQQKTTTKTIYY